MFQVNINKFVNMPRGQVNVDILGYSKFSKDSNIEYSDLVFKV